MTDIPSMISLEEARELVLSHIKPLPAETVPLLDALGRVAAADVESDMDAVSYTHLDVYKRQSMENSMVLTLWSNAST